MDDARLVRVPLHDRHVAAGGRMVPFAGFSMPVQFEGIKAEHLAVRTRVGLFDVSHMGEIRIRGPEALAVINGLISQDMRATLDGQIRYGVLCYEHGGVVDDLLAYRIDEQEFLLCVNATGRDKDFAYLTEHAPGGAEIIQESDRWSQLALQGPLAADLLQLLTDTVLAEVGYYHFTQGEVAGVPCIISRTGYTGEDGFEIYIPQDRTVEVYDAIVAAGPDFGLAQCGLGARDVLRLEAKMHLYGQELTEATNPIEAGLGWAVKLDKPEDFPGRAAIEAMKAEGPARRLRGFVLQSRGVPRAHYGVFAGDNQVGELTSGTWSPTLGAGIALGYVDINHASAEELDIDIRNRRFPATLTRKAFYKRP
jgi:aminomethyltransferase